MTESQLDQHHSKVSSVVFIENRGNTQTNNACVVQRTGTVSCLTTPKRLEGGSGQLVVKQWHRARSVKKEEERSERKKLARRSSTCHSCQTLLITAELCPAGWWVAFRAFHLTEVMGDEGSLYSHLKSVTVHPAVLVTSGHCWAACTYVNMSAAARQQRAQQILNTEQPVPHVSLQHFPHVILFVVVRHKISTCHHKLTYAELYLVTHFICIETQRKRLLRAAVKLVSSPGWCEWRAM